MVRSVVRSLLALAQGTLLTAALPAVLLAQGRITGVVTDSATGRPLGAVQVRVDGTSLGASTSDVGTFTIANVPAGTHVLEARRIGYRAVTTRDVRVADGATATVNIAMAASVLRLQETVVTGVVDPTSGVRVPFTVGKVTEEDLVVPPTNATEGLQGKVAGVSVTTGGQPGAGTNVVLRTPTSIAKSSEPLIVVDGVILTRAFGGTTADVDPQDIESIEVIKGAAAASLYGSRAANGVIQIRTKRGSSVAEGRTAVRVRSEFGSSALSREVDFARYHAYLTNEAGEFIDADSNVVTDRNARVDLPAFERFQDRTYPGQTWNQVDRFFDPGDFFSNTISVAQNSGRTNWLASATQHRSGGVVLDAGGYERTDGRLNLDHNVRDDLRMSLSLYHSRSERDELYGDTFFDLIFQPPDVDLRAEDPTGAPYIFQTDPRVEENPLYTLWAQQETTRRSRTLAGGDLKWSPLAWLGFDGNISYDKSDRTVDYFLDRGLRAEGGTGFSLGEVGRFTGNTNALNASVSANLLGRWRDVTGRLTLRGLMEREDNRTVDVDGEDLIAPGVTELENARIRSTASQHEVIRANGYFAITGVDIAGRYIADALVRRDESSLFGPEEREHTYYRLSGAWRVAAEPWWPAPAVTELKLRASQGTAGNRPSYADRFNTYSFTDEGNIGQQVTLNNPFLKPERAKETEVGIDAILLDRYSLQLTSARTTVTDQLLRVPLEAGYGAQYRWENTGTVKGRTLEATLEANWVNTPAFRWRSTLVFDRGRHRITSYGPACTPDVDNPIAYRCAGEELGTMYGRVWARDASQLPTDAQARASEFQVNDDGLLVYVGPDGDYRRGQADSLWGTATTIGSVQYKWGHPISARAADGSIVVDRIGRSTPDFRWGFSNNVTWKGFTVYGLLDAQVGGEVYNRSKQRMYQYARSADVDQSGKAQERKKPTDYYLTLYDVNDFNDWFVEDASFVKLRELSVRYRVPASRFAFLGRAGMDGVTFGLIGRNLLTFTDYSGYDPEVGAAGADGTTIGSAILRYDNFVYPPFRTLTGTVEIDF